MRWFTCTCLCCEWQIEFQSVEIPHPNFICAYCFGVAWEVLEKLKVPDALKTRQTRIKEMVGEDGDPGQP